MTASTPLPENNISYIHAHGPHSSCMCWSTKKEHTDYYLNAIGITDTMKHAEINVPLPEQGGIQLNTIYNEDCLETMKRMPDNFVDLVLTDPPYGIGEAAGKNKSRSKLAIAKDYGNLTWDNQIPSAEVFKEMLRVSKNQIIFGGNYFIEYLHNSSCWIVWDKNNSGDFADCELAWTSFNSAVRKFKWTWNGMIQEDMKNKEQRFHPTQKPVPVMKWILEKYSKETDLIYDPFMGSGTTARACKDLGRNYIGSEISKEYCDIAENRLRQGVLL